MPDDQHTGVEHQDRYPQRLHRIEIEYHGLSNSSTAKLIVETPVTSVAPASV